MYCSNICVNNAKKEPNRIAENDYYVLYKCNEWKERSSMKMVGVFTEKGLRKQIDKEIKNGNMKYLEYLNRKFNMQNVCVENLNLALEYGYIQRIFIDKTFKIVGGL